MELDNCAACGAETTVEQNLAFVDKVSKRLEETIVAQLPGIDKHDLWELSYILIHGTVAEHIAKEG